MIPLVEPGDVVVVRVPPELSVQAAADLKARLISLLPGVGDVVLLPFELLGVYRPSAELEHADG